MSSAVMDLAWGLLGLALGLGVVAISPWLEQQEGLESVVRSWRDWQRWGPPLLCAVLFALFAARDGQTRMPLLLAQSLWLVVMVQVIFFDLEHHLILDRILLPAAVLALAVSPFIPGLGWKRALLAGLVAGGVFLGLVLVGRLIYKADVLGLGDVKFVILSGFILGPLAVFDAIVTGMVLAGLISLLLIVIRVRGRRDVIAYAPYLALGTLLAMYRFGGA